MTRFVFWSVSFLAVLSQSCRQRAFNTETTTEGLKVSGVSGPEFHRGLVAKLGSEARRNAGESFERELREKIFPQLPQPDAEEHRAQVQLTQKALFFTAQYLKYGQECTAKEKITVYRGHNRPYVKSKSSYLFDVIYAPVWRNKAILVSEQPWKEWIWDDRKVSSPSVPDTEKETIALQGKWTVRSMPRKALALHCAAISWRARILYSTLFVA
jgi:hypothetical protein